MFGSKIQICENHYNIEQNKTRKTAKPYPVPATSEFPHGHSQVQGVTQ